MLKFIILVTKDAVLLCHKKCGEWLYLFATIVANTKILLDIAVLEHYILYIEILLCFGKSRC